MLKMFHCGPVMTEPTTVYLTFYGSWNKTREGPVLNSVLPILISGIASTPYWATVSNVYFNASGERVRYPSLSVSHAPLTLAQVRLLLHPWFSAGV